MRYILVPVVGFQFFYYQFLMGVVWLGQRGLVSRWEWEPVVRSDLMARGFHSCNVVQGKLLIFGGLKTQDTQEPPLGDVVAFDPAAQAVRLLAPEHGYRRSHHEAVVLGDRWLCVVGGWDGSRRVSDVCSFDAEQKQWEGWSARTSETPVGLSSHTCTKLTEHELLVVGREGGLHTQRRYASIFTLHLQRGITTASRAGHSAMLLQDYGPLGKSSGYKLLVFGGRDSADCDVAGHWSKGKLHVSQMPVHGLQTALSLGGHKGSRHHSCTVVGPHQRPGGGFRRICFTLAGASPANWFRFPSLTHAQKRCGHRTCLWNDKLYLVGGFGADGKTPCPEICSLRILP
uniref:Kelch domain containing 9 n=1 Tax=Naja naja TaxID=35670 RepID=A0A8C6VI40_NAJNA